MSIKFLLDPGHGGVAFSHYLTPGKRSPEVPPGIFEGEFNRAVCGYLNNGEKFLSIVPGPIQVPLESRVGFVNKLAKLEDIKDFELKNYVKIGIVALIIGVLIIAAGILPIQDIQKYFNSDFLSLLSNSIGGV